MNKPITKKEWMEYLEKTWNAAQEKAFAQPEQEPVAWYYKEGLERGVSLKQETFKWIPLYTTPPQPKEPEQEPEWYHGVDEHGCNRFYHKTEVRRSEFKTPLYTTPPQRTWVGLTDEEMQALWDRYAHMEMMRAIEAKLKEKNT